MVILITTKQLKDYLLKHNIKQKILNNNYDANSMMMMMNLLYNYNHLIPLFIHNISKNLC